MIQYLKGDIFSLEVDVYVNPVNCVGVMGKGLALKFKNKYPQMFKEYKEVCDLKLIRIGMMYVHQVNNDNKHGYIINFPTKDDWRNPSKIEYIEQGLINLKETIQKLNISSIAIPALGCGLGGLDWKEVKLLIEKYLSDICIDIYVFEPNEKDN